MWVPDTVPPTLHNWWLRLTWVIGLRKAPFYRIWSSVNLMWLIGLLWKCPRIGRQAGFCFYPKSTYILTEWLWAARQRTHPCKLRRTKPDGSIEYTIQHSTMWAHLREPALALVFFMSLLSATTTFLYIFRHRFSNICLSLPGTRYLYFPEHVVWPPEYLPMRLYSNTSSLALQNIPLHCHHSLTLVIAPDKLRLWHVFSSMRLYCNRCPQARPSALQFNTWQ